MPLRAVLFDIGDTLWYSRDAPPTAAFHQLAADRVAAELRCIGVTHADPARVARTARDALEEAIQRARSTDLVEPDYGAICRAALHQLGIEVDRNEAAAVLEAAYISGVEGGKAPYPDARSTVLELRRRGFRLGIVTNRAFGGERFRADLRDAGLDIGWDTSAVSVEVGYLKPHPALFNAALEGLGVQPSEAIMVGNSLAEDIAGAQALGIATAWRRSPPDAEDVQPDYAFDEVAELLEIPVLERSAP